MSSSTFRVSRFLVLLPGLSYATTGCNQAFDLKPTVLVGDERNSEVCNCTCFMPEATLQPASIDVGADDAEQVGTRLTTNGRVLDLGTTPQGDESTVGLRFKTLGIPKNSQILAATIQFTAAAASQADTNLSIVAEDAANATAFIIADLKTRPKTAAVAWHPATTWAPDQALADESTPDLSAQLQAVVNRTDWNPNNAVAFYLTGTGNRSAYAFENSPGTAAVLHVRFASPVSTKDYSVCMPDWINPNKGHPNPDPLTALPADCQGRVADSLSGLAKGCMYADHCTCNYVADSTQFVRQCDDGCVANELASDCSNLDPLQSKTGATNVQGTQPVCTPQGSLATQMYGLVSTAYVTGTATMHAAGESPSTTASGRIELLGRPCPPATSCSVSMFEDLTLASFEIGNLFGSAEFTQLGAVGGSNAGVMVSLDATTGKGSFQSGELSTSARGVRDNTDVEAFFAPNPKPLDLTVSWQQNATQCTLHGELAGTVNADEKRCENSDTVCTTDASLCGSDANCTGDAVGDGTNVCRCVQLGTSDATVSIDVTGRLSNQPPTASAGPNQTVECNLTGRGRFTLDGTATSDPDENITAFLWLRGSRVGDVIGFQPKITLEQAVGAKVDYFHRVIDAFAAADEAKATVEVVDTTPPTVFCNAPKTMTPNTSPVTFYASAIDVCDPTVVAVIDDYECFKLGKNGKVSKDGSCILSVKNNAITITSGGVDDYIRWTVHSTDHASNPNTGTVTCLVSVKNPTKP